MCMFKSVDTRPTQPIYQRDNFRWAQYTLEAMASPSFVAILTPRLSAS